MGDQQSARPRPRGRAGAGCAAHRPADAGRRARAAGGPSRDADRVAQRVRVADSGAVLEQDPQARRARGPRRRGRPTRRRWDRRHARAGAGWPPGCAPRRRRRRGALMSPYSLANVAFGSAPRSSSSSMTAARALARGELGREKGAVGGAQQRPAAMPLTSRSSAGVGRERRRHRSRVTDHERDGQAPVREGGIVVEHRLGAIPARPSDRAGAEREVEQPRSPQPRSPCVASTCATSAGQDAKPSSAATAR